MKKPVLVYAILIVCAVTGIVSCGGTPRQLQSISISPQTSTAQNGQSPQFTATGQFNTSPMTVTPLSVSWNLRGPGIDIPGPGYQLSAQPVTFQCISPGTYVIVALAPVDPKAPMNGPMPLQVYDDLTLQRTTTNEGGFVAATAQLTCP